jgi:hypothetical protein
VRPEPGISRAAEHQVAASRIVEDDNGPAAATSAAVTREFSVRGHDSNR